eukprot:c13698_g1_i1.p1 GENE.c13698_g1_i1~~c13698_g1_i1.p1  ORF type:complete len:174 (-),score=26.74 c13698_g1_i1:17-517(-)
MSRLYGLVLILFVLISVTQTLTIRNEKSHQERLIEIAEAMTNQLEPKVYQSIKDSPSLKKFKNIFFKFSEQEIYHGSRPAPIGTLTGQVDSLIVHGVLFFGIMMFLQVALHYKCKGDNAHEFLHICGDINIFWGQDLLFPPSSEEDGTKKNVINWTKKFLDQMLEE